MNINSGIRIPIDVILIIIYVSPFIIIIFVIDNDHRRRQHHSDHHDHVFQIYITIPHLNDPAYQHVRHGHSQQQVESANDPRQPVPWKAVTVPGEMICVFEKKKMNHDRIRC